MFTNRTRSRQHVLTVDNVTPAGVCVAQDDNMMVHDAGCPRTVDDVTALFHFYVSFHKAEAEYFLVVANISNL